jgi:putative transposase
MPRKARCLTNMGYYHILNRGNDKKEIFRYKEDYERFLDILKIYLAKFQINVFHYCLMPNHFHLLIQVIEAQDLPKFMQAILQVYASYFRKKYGSTGYTFQNRYKSFFINKESYLLECSRYIERNPLRAKIIHDLDEYPWNSLAFYTKGIDNDIINATNPCYLTLSESKRERQQRFRDYVLQERPYEKIVDEFFKIR